MSAHHCTPPAPQSIPACNMQIKMRLLPQGHSFELPVLSSILGLQGPGASSTWSRWPTAVFRQYWLIWATSDLCTNLTPEIGGRPFPSQQQRPGLQSLLGGGGRGGSGRVWRKMGELTSCLLGTALGLGGNQVTLLWLGFRKRLSDQHYSIICDLSPFLILLVLKHMTSDGCNSRNKNQFWVSEMQWRERCKGRDWLKSAKPLLGPGVKWLIL